MKIPSIQSEWSGRVIDDRFTLRQWLGGSGGSGVFVTELPGEAKQKAAIKLISAEANAEARVAAFASAAALSHPNLIRILDSGRCEIDGASFVYVVTEYADEVLSEILPMRPLTPEEVREMLIPVLDALLYIHGQGLVHGRLKPSNILVVNDQLKLSADSLLPAGHLTGDMHALSVHDAPECANGTLSPASDIWSLGVTIVEALTQRTPDWNRVSNLNPRLPESLPEPYRKIAASCLRVDAQSHCTIDAVRRDLGFVAAPPMVVQENTVEEEPAAKPRRSALLAVAVVVLAAAGFLWWRTGEPQPAQHTDEQTSAPATQSATEPAQPSKPTPSVPEAEQKPRTETAPPVAAPVTPPEPAPLPVPARVGRLNGTVAERVMPEVLPAARQSIQGRVLVRVRLNVNAAGDVTDTELETRGASKYFSRVSLETARKWKFTPAQVNGQPVATVWSLSFKFTREGTDVTPERTGQ